MRHHRCNGEKGLENNSEEPLISAAEHRKQAQFNPSCVENQNQEGNKRWGASSTGALLCRRGCVCLSLVPERRSGDQNVWDAGTRNKYRGIVVVDVKPYCRGTYETCPSVAHQMAESIINSARHTRSPLKEPLRSVRTRPIPTKPAP